MDLKKKNFDIFSIDVDSGRMKTSRNIDRELYGSLFNVYIVAVQDTRISKCKVSVHTYLLG